MRVALLGAGRLGAAHAKTLAGLPDTTELLIHDADLPRAREVALACGARPVESADGVLEGAEAAVIVTPTASHASLIRRCVDAGIPTFCEKPIAIDLAETREVVAHANGAGARLQIGFQRRFDSGFVAARRLRREGTLGSVYSFYMNSRDALPPPDEYVSTSGGQFKDQLIHDFDIARWLFDEEIDEVTAWGSTLGFDQYRGFGDTATSAVLVRLAGGTLGLINGARHNPAGYDIRVEIYGSRDSIAIGLDRHTPIRSVERDAPDLGGPAYPSFFVRFAEAYREELSHFLRFARGEAANACTAADALEALRVAEAAERSWHEARPVRIGEVA